jgi:hypothetical protein
LWYPSAKAEQLEIDCKIVLCFARNAGVWRM